MTIAGGRVRRGERMLLAHCGPWPEGPSAVERLELQVGPRLARILLFALSTPQSGRVGSSSP